MYSSTNTCFVLCETQVQERRDKDEGDHIIWRMMLDNFQFLIGHEFLLVPRHACCQVEVPCAG